MSAEATGPANQKRLELIEALVTPIKYARVRGAIDQVAKIAPFTPSELLRLVEIGEQTTRWEPPRITFYQDLLAGLEDRNGKTAQRLAALMKRVRDDLIFRLWKSNNYPTARMYMDALHSFHEFTAKDVDRIIAAKVENKRIAGMRLEPRQFLFYRDLLTRYASQISSERLAQLVGVLKAAVENDPALAQVDDGR